MWYRLAGFLKMSVRKCMRVTSSTEFLRWNAYLDRKEWHTHDKQDHYLAVIAYEIHRIYAGLAGKKEMPEFNRFLLEFGRGEEEVVEATGKTIGPAPKVVPPKAGPVMERPEEKGDFDKGGGMSGIEVGQPLDDKWQKVNAAAKAKWFAFVPEAARVKSEGQGDG